MKLWALVFIVLDRGVPQYIYFAATPPSTETPATESLSTDFLDPYSVLPVLVTLVEGREAPSIPAVEPYNDDLCVLTESATLAIRGADGDPEMEWEDLATQWSIFLSTTTQANKSLPSDEELLSLIDDLRALVSGAGDKERIYVRTYRSGGHA